MNRKQIIQMAQKAKLAFDSEEYPDIWQTYMYVGREEIEHFAKLVAEHERDELTVMFLEAHEGAKDNHNYWHVAANKIKEKK